MNRLEFMQELEALLSDISQSEKEEALQYYNDYLNDAGVENEEEVLESLGTPERLAKVIKEGLSYNASNGEFTETGYRDHYTQEEKQEVVKAGDKKSLSTGMIVLIIILCILASPLIISIATGVLGAGAGILIGIVGIFFGIAVTGFALFITAIVLVAVGVGSLFSIPLAGICLIGAGLLIGGLSLIFIWLTVWMCGTAIPWVIRTLADLIGKIFHGKGEKA